MARQQLRRLQLQRRQRQLGTRRRSQIVGAACRDTSTSVRATAVVTDLNRPHWQRRRESNCRGSGPGTSASTFDGEDFGFGDVVHAVSYHPDLGRKLLAVGMEHGLTFYEQRRLFDRALDQNEGGCADGALLDDGPYRRRNRMLLVQSSTKTPRDEETVPTAMKMVAAAAVATVSRALQYY